MLDAFGEVHPFLENNDLPPAQKLLDILNDPPKNRKLQMELAITIDFGEPFVKATYRLEGDGPLALNAYEEIAALHATISTQHFPNTNAVATKLSSNRPTSNKQQLISYATKCIKLSFSVIELKIKKKRAS